VPAAGVLAVEGLGVAAVQELHPGRELGARALDDQVVVVAEQAEGVHAPAETLHAAGEQGEEEQAVVVLQVDVAARDPARTHVVDPVGKQEARHPWHGDDASRLQRRFCRCGREVPDS
jgi:hypothetical protein